MKVRSKEAQSGTQNCSAYIVAAKYFDTWCLCASQREPMYENKQDHLA
jgi:hypothetical protein